MVQCHLGGKIKTTMKTRKQHFHLYLYYLCWINHSNVPLKKGKKTNKQTKDFLSKHLLLQLAYCGLFILIKLYKMYINALFL